VSSGGGPLGSLSNLLDRIPYGSKSDDGGTSLFVIELRRGRKRSQGRPGVRVGWVKNKRGCEQDGIREVAG